MKDKHEIDPIEKQLRLDYAQALKDDDMKAMDIQFKKMIRHIRGRNHEVGKKTSVVVQNKVAALEQSDDEFQGDWD